MFRTLALRAIVALGLFFTLVVVAQACPQVAEADKSLPYSSDELYEAKKFDVVAGGDTDLSDCPDADWHGFVADRPDFSMTYSPLRSKSGSMELELRTEGSCDTVLLVNDGDENWLFDDDTGTGDNSLLRLSAPPSGRYDIWVGTYTSSNCDASLAMETF